MTPVTEHEDVNYAGEVPTDLGRSLTDQTDKWIIQLTVDWHVDDQSWPAGWPAGCPIELPARYLMPVDLRTVRALCDERKANDVRHSAFCIFRAVTALYCSETDNNEVYTLSKFRSGVAGGAVEYTVNPKIRTLV